MASTDAVSNADLVHITGAGTCIVVASRAGNTNYVGSMAAPEKEHTISINQVATTTVTCGAGPFTYPALRSPCSPSVTGPGRLNHSLMVSYQNNANAGRATSSASHAGPINNQGSSAQKYFTIDKATLQITWNNPQAIDYGTALSSTQLNAEANVLGSFAYNPLAGTVLLCGTRG